MTRYAVQYTYNGLYVWSDLSLQDEPEWFGAAEAAALQRRFHMVATIIAPARIVNTDFDYLTNS